MAEYKILIKPTAVKELEQTPKKVAQQIVERISSLALHPRPAGCKKLSGEEKYRVRQGDHRIVYSIDDRSRVIEVVKIGHRREVYR